MATPSEAIAAHKVKMDAFMEQLGTSIDGVKGDVEAQAALIQQLQNNPGPISDADQAILDQLEAGSAALVDKIKAVDDLTPPAAPVV